MLDLFKKIFEIILSEILKNNSTRTLRQNVLNYIMTEHDRIFAHFIVPLVVIIFISYSYIELQNGAVYIPINSMVISDSTWANFEESTGAFFLLNPSNKYKILFENPLTSILSSEKFPIINDNMKRDKLVIERNKIELDLPFRNSSNELITFYINGKPIDEVIIDDVSIDLDEALPVSASIKEMIIGIFFSIIFGFGISLGTLLGLVENSTKYAKSNKST